MRNSIRLIALLGFLALSPATRPLSAVAANDITVIVNVQNPVAALTQAQLADFFFKKIRHWPDGTPVRFIDRREGSAERQEFLAQILGKTARDVELFWVGQKLYTGDAAPIRALSDSMAASLVNSLRGAVSYVSVAYKPGPGVKVITLRRD